MMEKFSDQILVHKKKVESFWKISYVNVVILIAYSISNIYQNLGWEMDSKMVWN